jgi:hypothetical protein
MSKMAMYRGDYPKRSTLTPHDLDAYGEGKKEITYVSQYRFKKLSHLRKFILHPMNLIDLVAILPWYVEKIVPAGSALVVFRIVRLARVTRLFKAAKRSPKMLVLINTFHECAGVVALLFCCIILVALLFGTLVMAAEQGSWHAPLDDCHGELCGANSVGATGNYLRPDVHGDSLEISPFSSVMQAGWAVVCTITTVGYGERDSSQPPRVSSH